MLADVANSAEADELRVCEGLFMPCMGWHIFKWSFEYMSFSTS